MYSVIIRIPQNCKTRTLLKGKCVIQIEYNTNWVVSASNHSQLIYSRFHKIGLEMMGITQKSLFMGRLSVTGTYPFLIYCT